MTYYIIIVWIQKLMNEYQKVDLDREINCRREVKNDSSYMISLNNEYLNPKQRNSKKSIK
ncbi:MAG: hypothetical protein ACXACX_01025 [Candidatus Hodarchaeales archaeon]